MKRWLRRIVKPFYRLTGPIRRPLSARFEAAVARATHSQLAGAYQHLETANASLGRLEQAGIPMREVVHEVHVARLQISELASDANLLLDSLVRELARLQRQVDVLQASIDDLSDRREGLSLVGADGPEAPARTMVG